jgi:hypothetical protein
VSIFAPTLEWFPHLKKAAISTCPGNKKTPLQEGGLNRHGIYKQHIINKHHAKISYLRDFMSYPADRLMRISKPCRHAAKYIHARFILWT